MAEAKGPSRDSPRYYVVSRRRTGPEWYFSKEGLPTLYCSVKDGVLLFNLESLFENLLSFIELGKMAVQNVNNSKIRILVLNPNSSRSMTDGMGAAIGKMPLPEVMAYNQATIMSNHKYLTILQGP